VRAVDCTIVLLPTTDRFVRTYSSVGAISIHKLKVLIYESGLEHLVGQKIPVSLERITDIRILHTPKNREDTTYTVISTTEIQLILVGQEPTGISLIFAGITNSRRFLADDNH
jgi:hypothetical protein